MRGMIDVREKMSSRGLEAGLLLACVVLGVLFLWYADAYLDNRRALKDACRFVARVEGAYWEKVDSLNVNSDMPPRPRFLDEANDACGELDAYP